MTWMLFFFVCLNLYVLSVARKKVWIWIWFWIWIWWWLTFTLFNFFNISEVNFNLGFLLWLYLAAKHEESRRPWKFEALLEVSLPYQLWKWSRLNFWSSYNSLFSNSLFMRVSLDYICDETAIYLGKVVNTGTHEAFWHIDVQISMLF